MPEISVKLAKYSGPLAVLLDLIKKQDIDIFDIPIAMITQQYLEKIEQMRELDLEVSGDFLIMATKLIRLKSTLLLPQKDAEKDYSLQDEIVQQLLNYQVISEITKKLHDNEKKRKTISLKKPSKLFFESQTSFKKGQIDSLDLSLVFNDILKKYSPKVTTQTIHARNWTVAEQKSEILDLLKKYDEITFIQLIKQHALSKNLIVTNLLALLDLVKTNEIIIYQDFDTMEITIQMVK